MRRANSAEIKIKDIGDAFEVYRLLISDDKNQNSNQSLLSKLALQIDSFSLAAIINFYNEFPDLSKKGELWKANLFIIRIFALITSEIIKFADEKIFEEIADLKGILNFRNKIHQFRRNDFKYKLDKIDFAMGRSRSNLTPRLDVALEYLSDEKGMTFYGTNIFQFHFVEASEQALVNIMQAIIRTVEEQSTYPPSNFRIKRSHSSPKYRWEVYCYTDIIKNAKFRNQNVLDRVLLAFDDLCCVMEFFKFVIENGRYLIAAPYLLYFLCKIIAIALDETFDNFKNYIKHSPVDDNDAHLLKNFLINIDNDFMAFCQRIRNNLHYQEQTTVMIGTADALYSFLQEELDIVQLLMKRIENSLNINPAKFKLLFYRLLRRVQLPNHTD